MKSKGMQLGAMFAAMLLVSMAFLGAAASNKEFPKDLPERVLLGLFNHKFFIVKNYVLFLEENEEK